MDERGLPVHPEIVTYATQSAFFTAYDCLDIGKVRVEVATYERGRGQTGRAVAYWSVSDLRLVIHALKSGQFDDLLGGKYEGFGGSVRDGAVESRVLRLERDAGEDGRFARFPLRLTVVNGPGRLTETGAIVPQGEPEVRVRIRFAVADLLRLLLEVEAYLDAYLCAHIQGIRAERAAALQRRLSGRGVSAAVETGTASAVAIRDPDAPMTAAQRRYLEDLAARAGVLDLEAHLGHALDEVTKGEASEAIGELKAMLAQGMGEPSVDWVAEIHRLGREKFGWDAARSEEAAARKMGKAFGDLSEDDLRAVAEAMEKAPLRRAA
ncbi:MAG: DUF3072 domain-containing protein [Chloroflexi bacterium]|nr:DUF3072 domain-containing protein [Chloroflexota bacterium]